MKHDLPLEDFNIVTAKVVTARKDHICICGKPIKKGEKYIKLFCKSYEAVMTLKAHYECYGSLEYALNYKWFGEHDEYYHHTPVENLHFMKGYGMIEHIKKPKLKLVRYIGKRLRKVK